MLFNSLDYMLFLTLAVAGYWLLFRYGLGRLVFLLGASCLFYMAWHPAYIVLILGSAVLDYTAGLKIAGSDDALVRKRWLTLSLTGNLGLLGVFKYFNFFAGAVTEGMGVLGVDATPWHLDVLLPVGISFYTFQTLSYTIDIYRGRLEPTRSFIQFACFVTYFPQLVAGPIVRAVDLLPQLARRPALTREGVSRGLFLIMTGIIKKVAIADFLSVNLVDRVSDNPEAYTATEVIIALYGFTMQIYCDFSGYTDVARGSAMLMGFQLPRNFDRPYMADNPAAFWRSWHMTLSSWLRDYLYFPLGGSRCSPVRSYWNIWITMFLIGLWHGAAWTFVWYGVIQATVLMVHRIFYRRAGRSKDSRDALGVYIFKVFCCLQFVVFSRLLFRATSMDNAFEVGARIFSGTFSVAQISTSLWLVLLGSFAAHYTPRGWYERLSQGFAKLPAPAQGVSLAVAGGLLSLVATSEVVPYIYCQF